MPRSLPRLAVLISALALGCGGNTPYYHLDWGGQDTVTVAPGDSVPYDIAIQRIADNLGEVRVSASITPEGVTFGPPFILPEGETIASTTATITVAPSVTSYGVNALQLIAEDPANNVTARGNISLVILEPPEPNEAFSISVEPRQVNVTPGQSGQTTVTVTRAEGFTGALTLSLETPGTTRLGSDPVTLAPGETTTQVRVTTDRSLNVLPYAVKFVATDETGRTAKTGFTFNLNFT
ncbi:MULTISPECIES: hypothetical protein [unclassified Corallococcus]|uniref:hypothetical protein n=1 Tax=unclassified Corallococcus TaxID=2685029 RepID=UPI001A8FB6EB|nr:MULTISPECIES: hypothetical protein [unclassified Corallococcus]MBN9687945.1 hypothetical protein [Corallococcus sp. NCSPR001]WAS88244.1 hypothetical protein O0N60_14960 [Corallococcus sp. NCRR]